MIKRKYIYISLPIIIGLVMGIYFFFIKKDENNCEKCVVLHVNQNEKYNVKIVNLVNDTKRDLGDYRAKDKKITISLDFIPKTGKINLLKTLFIVENDDEVGVGVYTYYTVNEPDEVTEKIYDIYEKEYSYQEPVTVHFYDKTTKKDLTYSSQEDNKLLKTFMSEQECIRVGYGAYIMTGYDEFGEPIGDLFTINNHSRVKMSHCMVKYIGKNVMHNFYIKKIKLSNNEQELNFVIPVEWLPSLILNLNLEKDEYTTYILKEKPIEMKIRVFFIKDEFSTIDKDRKPLNDIYIDPPTLEVTQISPDKINITVTNNFVDSYYNQVDLYVTLNGEEFCLGTANSYQSLSVERPILTNVNNYISARVGISQSDKSSSNVYKVYNTSGSIDNPISPTIELVKQSYSAITVNVTNNDTKETDLYLKINNYTYYLFENVQPNQTVTKTYVRLITNTPYYFYSYSSYYGLSSPVTSKSMYLDDRPIAINCYKIDE